MLWLMISSSVLLGVIGQILMKRGVGVLGEFTLSAGFNFFWQAASNPFILLGLTAYGAGTLLWLVILSRVEVSYAYPMLSLGYVLLLAYSYFFLHEHVSVLRLLGVLLIILGVILVAKSQGAVN